MAGVKNIVHVLSSPLPTKPINKEPRKINFFSSSSSCSSSQLFANQNFGLEANLSAKNSGRHVWHIKALAEEDRDLVSGKDDEEEGINQGEVTDNNERLLNAAIVLGAGTVAITRLLTIDHDYWHGWTLFEVLRYAPEHNWIAYEEALKSNPVLAKMVISGIVYSLGDWIAQCYEGKPLFEFDRSRMFRSGLVGFSLHGSLSHYYYQFSEALFPFNDWWVVPAKVVFDQTVWAALWNSIYYGCLGFLRLESSSSIIDELKATFWPMLTVRDTLHNPICYLDVLSQFFFNSLFFASCLCIQELHSSMVNIVSAYCEVLTSSSSSFSSISSPKPAVLKRKESVILISCIHIQFTWNIKLFYPLNIPLECSNEIYAKYIVHEAAKS